jgi:hypothetical protein
MVYYSPSARKDLGNILYGLLLWPKHPLEPEHAKQYVRDIEKTCRTLDNKFYHKKVLYSTHRLYGEFVHTYKRNKNTSCYIIYNIDFFNDVFIERIMNNYLTIA